MELIEQFSDNLSERYHNYMVGTASKADLFNWFQAAKPTVDASLENLRLEINHKLFTPVSSKLSEKELMLSKLYSEGLDHILSLSSYYTTPDTAFINITLSAELWRIPHAQGDSASLLFDKNPQNAFSSAESSILEYQDIRHVKQQRQPGNGALSSSPFTPILNNYFKWMQARLQPTQENLLIEIISVQSSIDSFDELMATLSLSQKPLSTRISSGTNSFNSTRG